MKLKDYRETYYTFSGKVSDISRQLSFAGIAIIWIFREGNSSQPSIPHELLYPLIAICVSLALDLSQYIVATAIWGIFTRYNERKLRNKEDEIKSPAYFNWPGNFFFWFKIIAVTCGYILIIRFLINKGWFN